MENDRYLLPLDTSKYPLLNETLFGNTYLQYLTGIIIFLVIFIGIRIFRRIILVRIEALAKKTKNDLDDHVVKATYNISKFFTFFLAFYLMMKTLNIEGKIENILNALFIILLVYEVIKYVQMIIMYVIKKFAKEENVTTIYGLKTVFSLVLWSVGILVILSNLGFNISALAASLGIGGVAIALAIQNILGDLFASFSIYFDKPFQIGDYIVIGSDKGTVQKIGLKTTRIKTLQGEELVVSNKELTSIRVQNFKKMRNRRVNFSIGVEYSTPTEKIKNIPKMIQEIINHQELAEFSRCHFELFGDFSLKFETVYFVNTSEYKKYMDIQQEINFEIKERFEKEKIEMAFPTQTVFVRK